MTEINMAEYYRRMNLPRIFWESRWDKIGEQNRDIVKKYITKAFAEKKGKGLLLWGEEGRGKSYIASVIAKTLRSRGYYVYFISAEDLDNSMFRRFFDKDITIGQRVKDVDLLVIDDLMYIGNKTMLYSILKYRNNNCLSTILTMMVSHTDIPVKTVNRDDVPDFKGFFGRYFPELLPVIRGNILPIQIIGSNYREQSESDYAQLMISEE